MCKLRLKLVRDFRIILFVAVACSIGEQLLDVQRGFVFVRIKYCFGRTGVQLSGSSACTLTEKVLVKSISRNIT